MILLGVEWRGMAFKVVVHEAEEGGFWAEVPLLPGCYTFAGSLDELSDRAREAITAHMGLIQDPVIPAEARVFEIAV